MVQHPYRHTQMYQNDVLLVTVTEVETMAVLHLFSGKSKHYIQDKTYYDLGEIGGAKVFLVQSEMGAGGQGGTIRTIEKGIEILSPSAVIMIGIAFGVDQTKQQIGDILVSQQILDYELQRVGSGANGESVIVSRGDKVAASLRLLNRFRDGAMEWKEANEPTRVKFGLILSGAKLVDNQDFRKQLRALGPEAIGGEMEGAGLYAAAQGNKVDWILVKAICDWADGNKSNNEQADQELAADNAARFVIHVIKQGGLKGEELLKRATPPFKPYTDNIIEPISTQQKAVELLEERIERFKELQVDIVRLKNIKELPGYLGNLKFTIEELEKRYQRLYQETERFMQKYISDHSSLTYKEFEEMVYRETSKRLNKTTLYDQWSIIVGNLLFPRLRRVDKILAQTNACITTLEAYSHSLQTLKQDWSSHHDVSMPFTSGDRE